MGRPNRAARNVVQASQEVAGVNHGPNSAGSCIAARMDKVGPAGATLTPGERITDEHLGAIGRCGIAASDTVMESHDFAEPVRRASQDSASFDRSLGATTRSY